MPDQPKRQTAVKLAIRDLLEGVYLQREGWEPNIVQTDYGDASRVNIMGAVVSKEQENPLSIQLQDGTGTIQVRSLDPQAIFKVKTGQIVVCIGRPREFQKQLFLNPEIIMPITNPAWVEVRKRELNQRVPIHKLTKTQIQTPVKHEEKNQISDSVHSPIEQTLAAIRKLDSGEGVRIQELIETKLITEGQIAYLLQQGEIFEVRPGMIKVLE